MTNLAGKHALVTGGGTGIGAAIALTLAQTGARVTICGRRPEPLAKTAASHEGIHAIAADVTAAINGNSITCTPAETTTAPNV